MLLIMVLCCIVSPREQELKRLASWPELINRICQTCHIVYSITLPTYIATSATIQYPSSVKAFNVCMQ